MSKIVCGKHKKLRHTRTIHRTRISAPLSPASLSLSLSHRLLVLSLLLVQGERSGHAGEKRGTLALKSVLPQEAGLWTQLIDIGRSIWTSAQVQTNAKVLASPRSTVVVQYQSRPSQSCFSSFVPFTANKVTLFRYLYRRRNELSYLFILNVAKEYFKSVKMKCVCVYKCIVILFS